MKTLEEYITYYGDTWGRIYFNEANPSYDFLIESDEY